MELKELPKTKENELTGLERDNLFESIVRGKDVTEIIHTTRGDFEIKFPRMRDLQAIGKLVAFRMNGLDSRCFDENTLSLMNMLATLDVLTVKGAPWYENAKRENGEFSWAEIPDQNFIQECYALAYSFRVKVQKAFSENKKNEGTGLDNRKDSSDSDGTGLFEGLSGASGTAG